MLRRATPFLGLLSATFAACTLVTDLDSLTIDVSPGDDAGAATPALDGATNAPDAGVSLDDGGETTVDAGGDAGTPPPTRFCRPGEHKLCFDFEDEAPLGNLTSETNPAGTIALTTERATSGTHGVRAELPRIASGDNARILQFLTEPFVGWTRVVAEASLFVEAPAWQSGDQNVALFGVGLHSGTGDHEAFIWTEPTRTALGSGSTSYSNGAAFPFNRWVRVRVEIDPAAGKVRGRIGDASFPDAPFTAVTPGSAQKASAGFGIFQYNKPAPKFVVYYDDVTLDW